MTLKKLERRRKKEALLTGIKHTVPTVPFLALLILTARLADKQSSGWNHVSLTLKQWLRCLAPYGVEVDAAFLEDMVSTINEVRENKSIECLDRSVADIIREVTPRGHKFDSEISKLIKLKQGAIKI
jgi:hypothetical protein